ncbi:hypothetical protein L593_00930 [Salinarchaeum sp. Harcht-Bsk1]|uniref:hypothetical protein n=1 Tax=Salinarchaeum sp. Harcht-Bsk1 TaxID=1333523 RepID=UPI00034231E1|nr:hypothetical protein [Salinarchaeum sp. Harcht-Bsk1]AGN00141.1 hypothetical protein L593_00930 [Salinarchaeum sp. Harcht-Bsk1]
MPEFRVAVDPETADAFQTEVDLLGFGDADEYLSWVVDNRASIEQGTESAELLDSYHERLVALEERLAAEGVDPATVDADTDPVSDARPDTIGTSDRTSTTDATTAKGSSSGRSTQSTLSDSQADGVDTIATSSDLSPSVDTGGTAANPDGREGVNAGGASSSEGDEQRAASDGGVSAEAEITSMHLQPERVQRVREDPVTRDADSLKDVETNRLDELSRRAVAETRQQLDREVETGLDYDSATTLGDSDVRPGEDLADLDALDVPGRTQGLVEARRVAVGRALAYLHDVGQARKRDFVDELYGDWPAGYESAAGWWRCIRGALEQVDAVDGGHIWEYQR